MSPVGQLSYPVTPLGHRPAGYRSDQVVPVGIVRWDRGVTRCPPRDIGVTRRSLGTAAKPSQADPSLLGVTIPGFLGKRQKRYRQTPPSGCNAPGLSRETGRPLQADPPPLGVTPPGFLGITARPLQEEEEEDEGVTPVGHRTYPVTPVVHRPMSHGRCPTAACLTAQGEGGGGGRGGDFVVDVGRLSSPSPPSVVGRRRRRRRRCRRRRGS